VSESPNPVREFRDTTLGPLGFSSPAPVPSVTAGKDSLLARLASSVLTKYPLLSVCAFDSIGSMASHSMFFLPVVDHNKHVERRSLSSISPFTACTPQHCHTNVPRRIYHRASDTHSGAP
jgi:hypothetical protein